MPISLQSSTPWENLLINLKHQNYIEWSTSTKLDLHITDDTTDMGHAKMYCTLQGNDPLP